MDDQYRAIVGTQSFTKFCPTCKFGNDSNALACAHCGSPLDLAVKNQPEKETKYAPPKDGLAFYFSGSGALITTATAEEFILGRESEDSSEPLVDLTYLDGFGLGVSRRHAKVRATTQGYEITDLNSSNGTWVDGKILPPSQAARLPSGSTLQLGRLKLIAVYDLHPAR
ncbi:MAG: FHA domain-containing protein [Anaerolineales bacterium]|nr:FHA domain-containing protein [Anaerolineales bacterium]